MTKNGIDITEVLNYMIPSIYVNHHESEDFNQSFWSEYFKLYIHTKEFANRFNIHSTEDFKNSYFSKYPELIEEYEKKFNQEKESFNFDEFKTKKININDITNKIDFKVRGGEHIEIYNYDIELTTMKLKFEVKFITFDKFKSDIKVFLDSELNDKFESIRILDDEEKYKNELSLVYQILDELKCVTWLYYINKNIKPKSKKLNKYKTEIIEQLPIEYKDYIIGLNNSIKYKFKYNKFKKVKNKKKFNLTNYNFDLLHDNKILMYLYITFYALILNLFCKFDETELNINQGSEITKYLTIFFIHVIRIFECDTVNYKKLYRFIANNSFNINIQTHFKDDLPDNTYNINNSMEIKNNYSTFKGDCFLNVNTFLSMKNESKLFDILANDLIKFDDLISFLYKFLIKKCKCFMHAEIKNIAKINENVSPPNSDYVFYCGRPGHAMLCKLKVNNDNVNIIKLDLNNLNKEILDSNDFQIYLKNYYKYNMINCNIYLFNQQLTEKYMLACVYKEKDKYEYIIHIYSSSNELTELVGGFLNKPVYVNETLKNAFCSALRKYNSENEIKMNGGDIVKILNILVKSFLVLFIVVLVILVIINYKRIIAFFKNL